MKMPSETVATIFTVLLSWVVPALGADTKTAAPIAVREGATAMTRVRGTFDVKLTAQPPEDKTEGSTLGRMSIDKQIHGPLEGTSHGEMLTAMTSVTGSAGYVAVERVTGMLDGRKGTFVLQHHGLMTRGAPELSVIVVPDSGTGELVGLSGSMTIKVEDGKHFYELEYSLAPAASPAK